MKHIQSTLWAILLLTMSMVMPSTAWADGEHQLTVKAKPAMAGSFNTNTVELAENESIHLYAYANANFTFLRWTDDKGNVVSQQMDFDYTMPDRNVELTAEYEYNPANPANPVRNYWNKELGEVIVDDFTTGSLQNAVKNVIGDSKGTDVQMITVAGVMNNNDFGLINTYTACSLLDLSRVTGITQVPSYAFDYTNLESVYLPAAIEAIGYRAFYECKQLSSLIVYAMTPPTLESNVFTGVPEGLVVYVPAAAIAQYQDASGWKDFTILPIQEDIRSITISLPIGTNVQDYAQMWLELTNTKSGQRMHYVMTDREAYTFANIIRNTSWNVTLRNERGDVFGQIDNVEVKEEDVSVTFVSLSKPQNVSLSVLTPDGRDVTSQVQVTWRDAKGNYMAQGASLSGLPVGYQASYSMVLPQELAMAYDTPTTANYTVKDGDNNIAQHLSPITRITLSGKVKDATTGLALSGAVVSASQTFGGKYSKTTNTKTDNNGLFTIEVYNVPTSLAFAATDYVSQTIDFPNNEFGGLNEFAVPDVSLKSIIGATINVGFTYTTVEGETQSWYSDYQNVGYTLYNITRARNISQYNVQYPQIVLLEEVEDGDVLQLTATSRATNYSNSTNVGAFMPVSTMVTIVEQKADATFAITELGKIQASFTQNGNATVVGSLYDATGKLLKTYNYSEASLTISDLADGNYTLVTMGSSRLFNTIYDLAQLPQTGLVEGTDYIKNTVQVQSGTISQINIAEVPTLDESKLYYTGDNTSFTVNKPSIVAGNYLTLTGRIDFKPAYATSVSNVQMIVDLPESCEFVENSVMVGNSTSIYTLNGNRISIPMARYTDRVRFCIIPTLGGEYAPSAFAQFDINGETVTQPIGSANYTAKDLSISVPSTVAKTTVPVSGTAIGTSNVEIYDNGVLIGQTTSLANGTWATTCELNEPYNLSRHQIQAKVTTKQGIELTSENVSCVYDMNAIQVSVVKMYHENPELHKSYELTFDFLNPSDKEENYIYYIYNKKFTFTIDFTINDTTKVSDVVLYVKTAKSGWHPLTATFDLKKGLWVAEGDFGNMYDGDLPVNVSVDFTSDTECLASSLKLEKMRHEASDGYSNYVQGRDEINRILSAAKDIINSAGDNTDDLLEAYDNLENVISSINTYYNLEMELEISPEYESLSEEELENTEEEDSIRMSQLLQEVELEMDHFNTYFVYQDFFEFFDDNTGTAITSSTCEGLVEEDLLSCGFQLITTDNGESIYAKFSSDTISYVNFNENIYQVVILSQLEDALFQASNIRKITSIEEMEIVAEQMMHLLKKIKATKGRIDKILAMLGKASISTIQNDYQEMLSNSKELASSLTNLADMVSEFVEKTQTKIFAPIKSLQDKYNKLHSEWSLAKAHAAKSKNYYRHLFWKSMAARLEEQMAPIQFILKQKWIANVGKFIAKYAPIANIVFTVASAAEKIGTIVGIASTIFPCEDDLWNACRAMVFAIDAIKDIGYYVAASLSVEVALDGTAIATSETIIGTVACVAIKFIASWGVDKVTGWHFNNKIKAIEKMIVNLKCYQPCKNGKCPDNNNDNDGGDHKSNNKDKKFGIDPSGYVYEGVLSNRVEGATATVFYKEDVEDMYGDLHENIVKWNAEEYAQENPLFTDESGYYRWDVPQGLWQVKFEKEGYETTYSEWLPVPPPQLDVNIAMRQNVQPNVKLARAFEDAVEVEFDKYMIPELLTIDNIFVMQGNQPVAGTIELVNEEAATEGSEETFASKIRFNAAQPFTEQEITLMVSNRVKSYAGIRMQDDYQQKFTIEQEIKQIVSDSLTVVGYGEEATLTVSVLPASASKGKMLTVKTSSPMILGVETEQVVIGDDGKAEITLSGELPGIAALTFSVEGTDKTALTIASVEQIEHAVVASPTANIASGSVVEKGTEIKLACETEGATIYYTLDGSCPCDETAQRNVYDGTPIVVNESMTIKAMAAKEGMDDSEVATFTYTAVQTGDVNGDGEVNLTDALWIVRHYVGRTPEGFIMNAADIDHSGEVNLSDAQKAVLIFVGKE